MGGAAVGRQDPSRDAPRTLQDVPVGTGLLENRTDGDRVHAGAFRHGVAADETGEPQRVQNKEPLIRQADRGHGSLRKECESCVAS